MFSALGRPQLNKATTTSLEEHELSYLLQNYPEDAGPMS